MPELFSRVRGKVLRHICLVLLALVSLNAFALDPNKNLTEFGNQVWLTENGLPQNTVQAIIQTRDGYLWLGTQEGLARFNGNNFVVFDRENTPELKSNDIRSLLEDRSGAIWIGTSYGLTRKQGSTFTLFTNSEGLPDNSVGSLSEGPDGTIWIATASGLARYSNNTITAFPKITDDIQTLFVETNGVVWLGTGKGVKCLNNGELQDSKPSTDLAGRNIAAIVQDESGLLWFGSDEGVIGYNQDQTISYTTGNGLPDNHINALTVDRQGSLWVSTNGGLARVRLEGQQKLMVAPGLSSNIVLTAFEDREGSLWVGTESGGLNLLRDRKFTTFTTKDGLSSDLVKAVYQDVTGAIWIGTNGGGVTVLKNGQATSFTTKEGLSSNVVLSLYGDDKGTIWIGTPDGLNQYKDGKFTTLTVADGLSSDLVRSIYVDRAGNIWVGTRNGLNRIRDGQFSIFTTKDGLADDFIGAIFEDSKGALWVGTRVGLSELNAGKFRNYTARDGLSSEVITSLHEDTDHNLWIGTNGGGLNRLRNGQLTSFTTRNGLPDNVIYRILQDAEGNLWVSSPKGIFKVALSDLDSLAQGHSSNLNAQSYGISDGMLTRECSGGGHPAGWRGNDGKLWFSTIKGVAMVDPGNIQFNKQPPPVAIEQIRVDDRELNSSGNLQLSPATSRLEFYYAALSFVAPDRIRFKYRLEGFDPDWIDAGTKRIASYTNLRPGTYKFHVIAANGDGVWNQEGAILQFYLKPHFYQTYWFYALLILLLAVLIWQIYRFRVRQIKAQFDAVLGERTRIAREIHDNLAQEMLGISVQLEVVARTMPPGSEVAQNHLNRVRMLVRHGIAEARRYVWDLRSQALDHGDLPTALSDTARRLTADAAVEAQVQVGGVFRKLPRPVEDNLLRIAQEAINNAVAHAQPERIWINLQFDIKRVQLSVRDDGRGFDQATSTSNGHFGLTGMRERAEQIGGTLSINSSVGNGTEVMVDVPIPN